MKKKLIIHMGLGKTGTTSIQKFLRSNKEQLLAFDIDYPELGCMAGAHHLLSPHRPPFAPAHWKFLSPEQWVPKLALSPGSTVVISSELISRSEQDSIEQLFTLADEYFDVSLAVYLRRQDKMIMASYSQQVKAGTQLRPIHKIYETKIGEFDYCELLARWERFVKPENIVLRSYDQAQSGILDVRHDFVTKVLKLTEIDGLHFSDNKSNPSLLPATCEYKRMVNCLIQDRVLGKRFNASLLHPDLHGQLSELPGATTHPLLSKGERKDILDSCEASNRDIANRYYAGKKLFEIPRMTKDPERGYVLGLRAAKIISSFIQENDKQLVKELRRAIGACQGSSCEPERSSARFLLQSLPPRNKTWELGSKLLGAAK